MKGETLLQRAWQENSDTVPKEEGSFFAASPLRRIIVSIAGPAVNFVFAIVVLAIVWGIGFSINTFPNRIVLASEVEAQQSGQQGAGSNNQQSGQQSNEAPYPADAAGLETGDVITRINGQEVSHFQDLQQLVAQSARQELELRVRRDGETITTTITPALDKSTGAGRIGVYPWVDPVVGQVAPNSPAALAGLKSGDRIVTVNGEPAKHSMIFREHVKSPAEPVEITFERDGTRKQTTLVPRETKEGQIQTGLRFQMKQVPTPDYGFFGSIQKGAEETYNTLALTVRSIGLLFGGVDATQAVAGPLRITYYIGDVATQGFSAGGVGTGLRSFFNFLSLLSVALFFMNLLPIPILDGGQIVLYTIEGVARKPLHPKAIYYYQMVGMVIVFALILFALFGDILFLTGRG
jgi:regulator of sigma E protease